MKIFRWKRYSRTFSSHCKSQDSITDSL